LKLLTPSNRRKLHLNLLKKQQTPWPLVRKRTIPTDRPPLNLLLPLYKCMHQSLVSHNRIFSCCINHINFTTLQGCFLRSRKLRLTTVGDPPHRPRDTPLSTKVGTKFRRQVAVAQSV
jgi:hypothetical protein